MFYGDVSGSWSHLSALATTVFIIRNQSFDLESNSIDWLLYNGNVGL